MADDATEREQRVTPLELFFDLVVVFAITEVTQLMARDLTWAGLGRGMLVLAAIWWSWTGYAWLTNNGMFAASLAPAMAVCWGLIAWDLIHYREERVLVRRARP